MKRLLPLMVMLGVSGGVRAASVCERLPVDPEFPAGLSGSYEIVGKDPAKGTVYTGTLTLDYGKDSYVLSRGTDGQTLHGVAWIQRCGVDKIRTLLVRYDTQPAIEMACALQTDGDNYYRATCRTRQGGDQSGGLEAWFQKP
ncbi:hypothetical protein [Pseudoxanthomonas sp.]|uniref:hypothetical protein n=1 Tax=Pseudoxanthomonas sp. TaxID=1871049 RepID=UPI00261CE33E|nr:hypothetical protein [Pseudoxanthomonas sp.]WDS35244.1 MAG: hypothetical protein O8I58_12865 [Pseudoxanthomonas sp.]